MDPLTVRTRAREILASIREQPRPVFLEMTCYRFVGHGVADNAQQQRFYRTEEEIAEWRARDPIENLKKHLVQAGELDDQQIEAMEREIADVITDAIQFAEASPPPPRESLYEHVTVERQK